MTKITCETIIDRPVTDVFQFIANPLNDPQWCPPVLEAEQATGDRPAPGARYRQRVKPGPRELISTLEIVELEPPHRMTWRGENEMLQFEGFYEVQPDGNGTRVRMVSHLSGRGIWRLLMPIIGRASDGVVQEEFENLKNLLESEPATPRDSETIR